MPRENLRKRHFTRSPLFSLLVFTSSGAFTAYHPESPAQADHVEPPPMDMHTYLPIYPYIAALLYGRAYINEASLLCGRLYLYLPMADDLMESARTGKQ